MGFTICHEVIRSIWRTSGIRSLSWVFLGGKTYATIRVQARLCGSGRFSMRPLVRCAAHRLPSSLFYSFLLYLLQLLLPFCIPCLLCLCHCRQGVCVSFRSHSPEMQWSSDKNGATVANANLLHPSN
mgnify:CR=1 FL=1